MNIDEKRVYNDFDFNNFIDEKINNDFNSKKQFIHQKNNSFIRKSIR